MDILLNTDFWALTPDFMTELMWGKAWAAEFLKVPQMILI